MLAAHRQRELAAAAEAAGGVVYHDWENHTPRERAGRITINGRENDQTKEIVYHLYDEFDKATKISSMARTTGYTCTAAVNMLLEGLFTDKWVFPPELIGKHEKCFEYSLNYLKERNVMYRKEERI